MCPSLCSAKFYSAPCSSHLENWINPQRLFRGCKCSTFPRNFLLIKVSCLSWFKLRKRSETSGILRGTSQLSKFTFWFTLREENVFDVCAKVSGKMFHSCFKLKTKFSFDKLELSTQTSFHESQYWLSLNPFALVHIIEYSAPQFIRICVCLVFAERMRTKRRKKLCLSNIRKDENLTKHSYHVQSITSKFQIFPFMRCCTFRSLRHKFGTFYRRWSTFLFVPGCLCK